MLDKKSLLNRNALYDGITIFVRSDTTANLLRRKFEFLDCNKHSGEVMSDHERRQYPRARYMQAKDKGLIFNIYHPKDDNMPKKQILTVIRGSLHNYFNCGIQNYDLFTLNNCKTAIERFAKEYSIDLNIAEVHALEIGVNLQVPFAPKLFIDSLIIHKSNKFNCMDIKGACGKSTLQTGKQYYLKIYDKGSQFRYLTSDQILRFELKAQKMEAISKGTIKLYDLLSPTFLDKCKAILLKRFLEIIILEPIDQSLMTLKDRILYLNCLNSDFWLRQNDKCVRSRFKSKVNKINDKYNPNGLKENVYNLLKIAI